MATSIYLRSLSRDKVAEELFALSKQDNKAWTAVWVTNDVVRLEDWNTPDEALKFLTEVGILKTVLYGYVYHGEYIPHPSVDREPGYEATRRKAAAEQRT